jgi:hypothetical protein
MAPPAQNPNPNPNLNAYAERWVVGQSKRGGREIAGLASYSAGLFSRRHSRCALERWLVEGNELHWSPVKKPD